MTPGSTGKFGKWPATQNSSGRTSLYPAIVWFAVSMWTTAVRCSMCPRWGMALRISSRPAITRFRSSVAGSMMSGGGMASADELGDLFQVGEQGVRAVLRVLQLLGGRGERILVAGIEGRPHPPFLSRPNVPRQAADDVQDLERLQPAGP